MNPTTNRNMRFLPALALLALALILAAGLSPTARAADFTAANEAELAAAITAANAAGAGDHTIALTANISLTAPLPALHNPTATGITLSLIHIFTALARRIHESVSAQTDCGGLLLRVNRSA